MSDHDAKFLGTETLHSDVVREALEQRDAALIRASENRQRAEAAEAERDEARRELDETVEAYHARLREKSAAEARVTALEAALRASVEAEEYLRDVARDHDDKNGAAIHGYAAGLARAALGKAEG